MSPQLSLLGVGRLGGAPRGATLGMWLAMTAVMMTPVVVPWLRTLKRIGSGSQRAPSATLFALGYATAWAVFSGAAARVQTLLANAGADVPLLETAPFTAAAALILIGGYQFTHLKNRCLAHCRSPAGYLLDHWKPGRVGSLRMGMGHGLFCLGCCWALMLLALIVGAMDLRWMLLLTTAMVIETTVPHGHRVTRPLGAVLVAGGLATLLP